MGRRQRAFHGKTCPYCGERMVNGKSYHRRFPTKDHLNPRSRGGGPSIVVCRQCNADKGNMPLEDWINYLLAERPAQNPRSGCRVAPCQFRAVRRQR